MVKNLRVLLDTNIYGLIAKEENSAELISKIAESDSVVCGSTVIRKELRDVPKKAVVGKRKLRSVLLSFYDSLIDGKRNYRSTSIVEDIAKRFDYEYKGSHSWKEMKNDFLIVAVASLHEIDLIVSDDEKTMANRYALKAYEKVNKELELRNPKFIKFDKFKSSL